MNIDRNSNNWKTLCRINAEALKQIAERMGRQVGIQEIEFRSTFLTNAVANRTRDSLRERLISKDGDHIFIMNNFHNLHHYDCLYSTFLEVTPENLTDIECIFTEEATRMGGENVNWAS